MKKLRALRILGALATLALAVPTALAHDAVSSADLGQASASCIPRPGAGLWNLPSDRPGHVRGILATRRGEPVLYVEALLLPREEAAVPGGLLLGRLLRVPEEGAEPEPVATVRGRWHLLPNGSGVFEAIFLRPGAQHHPVPVGGMHGRFLDDPDPAERGRFRARWVVCR